MTKLFLLLAATLPQDEGGENFHRFSKGTTWTYDEVKGDAKGKVVLKVTERTREETRLESKEYRDGNEEPAKTESGLLRVEDGYLILGDGRRESNRMRLLKFGSKKGDTWPAAAGPDAEGDIKAMTLTHMGEVKVEVPFRAFEKAVWIRATRPDQTGTWDVYLAPGVGIIKMHLRVGEKTLWIRKLKDFSKVG